MKDEYIEILENYPVVVSKETMCKICNISKRTAYFLLTTGLVPCKKNDKKTRKYNIKTKDIVKYLIDRQKHPEKYSRPSNWYKSIKTVCVASSYDFSSKIKRRSYISSILNNYPDVLSVTMVAEITGYSYSTVGKWCASGELKYITVRNAVVIPKKYLHDFLMNANARILISMSRCHENVGFEPKQ